MFTSWTRCNSKMDATNTVQILGASPKRFSWIIYKFWDWIQVKQTWHPSGSILQGCTRPVYLYLCPVGFPKNHRRPLHMPVVFSMPYEHAHMPCGHSHYVLWAFPTAWKWLKWAWKIRFPDILSVCLFFYAFGAFELKNIMGFCIFLSFLHYWLSIYPCFPQCKLGNTPYQSRQFAYNWNINSEYCNLVYSKLLSISL